MTSDWITFVRRNRSLLVSVAIVALPVVIILPIPTLLMDLLLTLNITFAILVLLTTIYTTDPLEFAVFPSLLLVTTLYRLVLNVATTRLILGNAQEGENAAGTVVRTFGDFVAGGHEVVGFILFAILVIIQFVVITRGATRISEVAARFTLDAMPGKQMAIDADLNAGLVTETEARDRRQKIAREADFYGAMDGASKFVRGDAVAGLIITLINIIGGLSIGMIQHGMDLAEAGRTFSRLTIGDGLVTQIPAFILSIAAGLIVTRATAEKELGEELVGQIFNRPVTLWITAGFLGVLLLTPMTKPVVLLVGGGCALGAWWLGRQRKDAEVRAQEETRRAEAKAPPKVETLLHVDPMELEVGYGLIRLVDASQGGELLDRIQMIRRQTALELGVKVPPIRIRDNMQLDANQYVVKIRGTRLAEGTTLPDHYLAMDGGAATGKVQGIETVDPAFGTPAIWVTPTERARAESLGYIVADATTVLATHLTEVIKSNAHELLTRQEVGGLLDNLKERAPKLVEEVTKSLSTGEIQKVLQNLLRERVSIRDLETILETLGDYAARTQKDPELLTEYARNALGRQICASHREEDGSIRAVALDPKLEEGITRAIERTEGGSFLTLSPATVRRIVEGISKEIEKGIAAGHQPVVLAAPQVRLQVRRMLEGTGLQIAVLSYNEIVKGVRVETEGLVPPDAILAAAAPAGGKK